MKVAKVDHLCLCTGFCGALEYELRESSRGTPDGPGAPVDGKNFHGGTPLLIRDGPAEVIMTGVSGDKKTRLSETASRSEDLFWVKYQYSPEILLFLRRYLRKFFGTKTKLKKVIVVLPVCPFHVMKTVFGSITL
jgi:hypothetical protein